MINKTSSVPAPSGIVLAANNTLSRRSVLRIGGLSIGLAALVAACADESKDASPARVGTAQPKSKLPDAPVNDGVLFRTASSLHYSIIDSHNATKKYGKLSDEQTAIVDAYIAANRDAIKTLEGLTTKAGGKVYGCANTRFDRVVLTPLVARITGRPKQGSEEADVVASDNVTRDALALAHAMETVGAAMHQSLVPQLSKPELRASAMILGQAAARRAAALALAINPSNLIDPIQVTNANPGVILPDPVGDEKKVKTQQYYAIPSQFGLQAATQLQIGKFSEAGTQFALNIETLGQNSFVYDDQTC